MHGPDAAANCGPSPFEARPSAERLRVTGTAFATFRVQFGCARNVMRAGLWPIFAGARRAEKPAAVSFCDHRRLAVAGETEIRAQAPVVGRRTVRHEPDQGGAEKAIGARQNESAPPHRPGPRRAAG